ncbi:hypothetical protein BDU57DRAFT_311929 [Ampelomyces quisqualis]|uniref:Uncharacterized protein n=1 Tax=Ampelomyces quisqualis TaxID=50730 RepID=A0A6A5QFC8_AMPQU|nr:hypothetical protein BDU57DRAFT_311929 [Ampelomyces quisqualis]
MICGGGGGAKRRARWYRTSRPRGCSGEPKARDSDICWGWADAARAKKERRQRCRVFTQSVNNNNNNNRAGARWGSVEEITVVLCTEYVDIRLTAGCRVGWSEIWRGRTQHWWSRMHFDISALGRRSWPRGLRRMRGEQETVPKVAKAVGA